jgi:hypothetical protein
MLNAKEARALFEELSASERESEEHGSKENSCNVEIDPLTRKIQGMPLTQPVASETHQAEQKIRAQPSDGKKMPCPRFMRSSSTTPRTSRAAARFESTDSQAGEG